MCPVAYDFKETSPLHTLQYTKLYTCDLQREYIQEIKSFYLRTNILSDDARKMCAEHTFPSFHRKLRSIAIVLNRFVKFHIQGSYDESTLSTVLQGLSADPVFSTIAEDIAYGAYRSPRGVEAGYPKHEYPMTNENRQIMRNVVAWLTEDFRSTYMQNYDRVVGNVVVKLCTNPHPMVC
jgi:hypothetical protein